MKESNNNVEVTEFKDEKSEVQSIGNYGTLFSNVDWLDPEGFTRRNGITLFDVGLTDKKIPNGHFVLGSSTFDIGDASEGLCDLVCYSIVSSKEAPLEDGEYDGPWGKKPGIHGFRLTSAVDNLFQREREIEARYTKDAIRTEFAKNLQYRARNVAGATNMVYADITNRKNSNRGAADDLEAVNRTLNRYKAPFFIDKTVPYTFWDTSDGSHRVYRLAAEHDPNFKPRVTRTKTISDGYGGTVVQKEVLQIEVPREPREIDPLTGNWGPYGRVKYYADIADMKITPVTNEWILSLFDVRTESASAKYKYEMRVMNLLLYVGANEYGLNKIKNYCTEYFKEIRGHNYVKLVTGGLNKQDALDLAQLINYKDVIGESTDRALQMAVAYCKDRNIDLTAGEDPALQYNRLTKAPVNNVFGDPKPQRPFEFENGKVTNLSNSLPIHPRFVADIAISTNPTEDDQAWYSASYAIQSADVDIGSADQEALKNLLTGKVKPTSEQGKQFLAVQKEQNPDLHAAIKKWVNANNHRRSQNLINIAKAMDTPYKYLGGQIHQMESKFVTSNGLGFTTSKLMKNYFGFGSQSMGTRPKIDIIQQYNLPRNWDGYRGINPKIQPTDLGGLSGPAGSRGIEAMIKSQNKVDLLNESATAYYVSGPSFANETKTKVYIGNEKSIKMLNYKLGLIFSDEAQDKMMQEWTNPQMFEIHIGTPASGLNSIATASKNELARIEREAWENSMLYKTQQACIAALNGIANWVDGWDSEPDPVKMKLGLQNYVNFANRKGLANKVRNPLSKGSVWKDRN